MMEKKLNVEHIKIIGCIDKPGKNISLCFSAEKYISDELFKNDFIISSEISEQIIGENIRDCAELGINKSLIVIPHSIIKLAGLIKLRTFMSEQFPSISSRYIECTELYSYTDMNL